MIEILENWKSASDADCLKVKKWLMPEDDVEHLFLRVTDHPKLKNGRIVVDWFEIEAFNDTTLIASIIVVDEYNISYLWY